ncbi:hypothetical protein AB0P40_31285 [Streptomyces sp. NPDC079189]|uniref:MmyB family transcriptional regulator n=1 Tax=Streptomyces sp. NPDC079189 TaxID=3154514 RepID=UPI0034159F5A
MSSPDRELYPERAAVAAETVSQLRLDAGLHPTDRQLATLVGELSLRSEDFRRGRTTRSRRRRTEAHPASRGRRTELPYETLARPGDPDWSFWSSVRRSRIPRLPSGSRSWRAGRPRPPDGQPLAAGGPAWRYVAGTAAPPVSQGAGRRRSPRGTRVRVRAG